jgi:argonaute-like protein implicated in RNA metabolism and viral defense
MNEQLIIMFACDGLAEVKPKPRFLQISEEQLQTIVENKDAVNMKCSTRAVTIDVKGRQPHGSDTIMITCVFSSMGTMELPGCL